MSNWNELGSLPYVQKGEPIAGSTASPPDSEGAVNRVPAILAQNLAYLKERNLDPLLAVVEVSSDYTANPNTAYNIDMTTDRIIAVSQATAGQMIRLKASTGSGSSTLTLTFTTQLLDSKNTHKLTGMFDLVLYCNGVDWLPLGLSDLSLSKYNGTSVASLLGMAEAQLLTNTAVVTSDFNVATKFVHLVDNSAALFNATLPENPADESRFAILDVKGTLKTRELNLLTPVGQTYTVEGVAGPYRVKGSGSYVEFMFSAILNNWLVVSSGVTGISTPIVDDFTASDNQTTFTLSQNPLMDKPIFLELGGMIYRAPDVTVAGKILTWSDRFNFRTGDKVSVQYYY